MNNRNPNIGPSGRRNQFLEHAIECIRRSEKHQRETSSQDGEDKAFCEGYEQALSELCISNIKFWMDVL